MRSLALTTLILVALAGCIHLPAEVAAVVRESDPPGLNNFRPETPPQRAADNAEPASP